MRPQQVGELVEQTLADVRVGHLPPAEQDRQFDLVAGVQKLRRLPTFGLQIVIVDLRPDPDFFQLDDVLVPARLTFFAALLVSELAVVHEPADRRDRIRRHLDEIEPALPRHL